MSFTCLFTTYLKPFDITNLFDRSVILFDLPMLIMFKVKCLTIKLAEFFFIG